MVIRVIDLFSPTPSIDLKTTNAPKLRTLPVEMFEERKKCLIVFRYVCLVTGHADQLQTTTNNDLS